MDILSNWPENIARVKLGEKLMEFLQLVGGVIDPKKQGAINARYRKSLQKRQKFGHAHKNCKLMKIHENPWRSMKSDENQ